MTRQNSGLSQPFKPLGLTLWLAVALIPAISCTGDDSPPTVPTSPVDEPAALSVTATQALSLVQVSPGMDFFHSCAVTTTNQAYCWGTGYLGDGPAASTKRVTPVAVAGGHQFRQISSGYSYTCAVTTDNRAFCWGDNDAGELGDGTRTDRPTPVPVATGLRFRHVSAGHNATCGLSTENRVYCWGGSAAGVLGTGTTTQLYNNPPTEIAGGRRYRQVDAGLDHSCAVTTAYQIFCWGRNDYGQLGDGSTAKVRLKPVLVTGGRSYGQVSAGWLFTCAVTTGSRALCWGWGRYGTIGDGKTLDRWEPRHVAGTVLFSRVTAGTEVTCGESTGNRAYCWGYPGLVGDGTKTIRLTPVPVSGGLFFRQVSSGNGVTCGVSSESRGYCWGGNFNGALGDGTTTDRLTPVPIAGPN